MKRVIHLAECFGVVAHPTWTQTTYGAATAAGGTMCPATTYMAAELYPDETVWLETAEQPEHLRDLLAVDDALYEFDQTDEMGMAVLAVARSLRDQLVTAFSDNLPAARTAAAVVDAYVRDHVEQATEDDDQQTCRRCGDHVYTLSTDNLCDGCVAEQDGRGSAPYSPAVES